MRAIVIEQPNEVVLRDVETPRAGAGEVRVRSVLAGVCRTDLDIATGALDPRWVRFPVVPGHEWSGVVDSVGEAVTGVEPGQRVVCEGNIGCMRCPRCRAGDTHLCQSYDAVGFTRG
ncbi:MAG: alcohol dehydrogenase catalytic domain-containing protein, partial [Gaiellaceae bacterium]